jgi:hypothetical protein
MGRRTGFALIGEKNLKNSFCKVNEVEKGNGKGKT